MIVKNINSPCWLADAVMLSEAADRLDVLLQAAPAGTEIFFRADDIGVPGEKCRMMMDAFRHHTIPLHMAVTPAWLSESRWATLSEWGGKDDLWCWHQHGWRHVNHQQSGKKGEFGSDRTREAKRSDLLKGRTKLETIMGDAFRPFFTPPWNRFDTDTGEILKELGYQVVSRSTGEIRKVPLPEGLPDIAINVDLHTRSEAEPQKGLDALLDEFAKAVESGRVGVMLHHQRMNEASFSFLDSLLAMVSTKDNLKVTRFDVI